MLRRGWSHEALMAMAEADFGFWLGQQLDFDRAEAAARRKAARSAKS